MSLKLAPEPKYKKLYSQLLKEHKELKLENDLLKDKVFRLSNMILTNKTESVAVHDGDLMVEVPKHIVEWMLEYNLPWQVFKCEEHGDWITDLDCFFPYFMDQCKCNLCK